MQPMTLSGRRTGSAAMNAGQHQHQGSSKGSTALRQSLLGLELPQPPDPASPAHVQHSASAPEPYGSRSDFSPMSGLEKPFNGGGGGGGGAMTTSAQLEQAASERAAAKVIPVQQLCQLLSLVLIPLLILVHQNNTVAPGVVPAVGRGLPQRPPQLRTRRSRRFHAVLDHMII